MSDAPARPQRPGPDPGPVGGHGLTGVADAGAFLARLVRLDPAAPVRLRPAAPAGGPDAAGGRTALWARLPWGVLAVRTVAGPGCGDVTVAAGELLDALSSGAGGLPVRRDAQWRWPLPPPASRSVELLPAGELWRIAEAAAGTLREAAAHGVAGRAVGQRVLRDALLDHVAVVVTPDDPPGPPVEIAQRLVQGLVRMGFLGRPGDGDTAAAGPGAGAGGGDVQVRTAGRWVGLVGPYGAVWSQKVVDLAVMPLGTHPKV
ncbi:hypothetical protein [Micromonospora carbonacea]|uniref:Uncharacterized protein n=1 Tax=Micromonospora carbonacea TaxID=47853 RepID=A0A7H8XQV1_9ACTN|nr:hypothetical protein [Micromonospora carbonacea]MBB5824764.1 hypothetical protein [Micromonospora carbonacea]QLD27080.1 hypothetical protein HXZ27_25110 [Micromonospora carbonacea]